MPLTDFQRALLAVLAAAPTDDRYLAGGTAMHFAPNTARYSDDLDFFHDSEERVASAFAADRDRLHRAGYTIEIILSLPGFIRAVVRRGDAETRVDWAHDSAWRFMPLVRDQLGGLLLDPIDLAINKALTLAGRDEPRDFVDILFVHRRVLPLAGLAWAAVGKDPGFTPLSLLELLKRRGHYRPEDFGRLNLAQPFDLPGEKPVWLDALDRAETFARERPTDEYGCLYYSTRQRGFTLPRPDASLDEQGIVVHFGSPGEVLPRVPDQ
ncbi:MAG: nucleotidyl transferase AbiEii/AbiGii toxin family protein [Gemmatimonadales bacterium]